MEGLKYRSSQNRQNERKDYLVETDVGISDGVRVLAGAPTSDNKTGEAAYRLQGELGGSRALIIMGKGRT
jgi:hypothetical protein